MLRLSDVYCPILPPFAGVRANKAQPHIELVLVIIQLQMLDKNNLTGEKYS